MAIVLKRWIHDFKIIKQKCVLGVCFFRIFCSWFSFSKFCSLYAKWVNVVMCWNLQMLQSRKMKCAAPAADCLKSSFFENYLKLTKILLTISAQSKKPFVEMIQFVNVIESQIEHESAQIRYIECNSIELSIKMDSNSAFLKSTRL